MSFYSITNGNVTKHDQGHLQNVFYEGRNSFWNHEVGFDKDLTWNGQIDVEQGAELKEIKQIKHSPLSSFRFQWTKWGNRTTFHGVYKIFDAETFVIRRVVWLGLIIVMFYLLCSGCLTQLYRYLAYKTLNQESIRYEEKIRFPAVTVCNLNRIHNDTVDDERDRYILRHLYMYPPNSSAFLDYPGESYTKSVSLRELFMQSAMTVKEMFKSCSWSSNAFRNCSEILEGKFRETFFCHTANHGERNTSLVTTSTGADNGLTLLLWANQVKYFVADSASAGFKVLVHDQDEEPDVTQALAIGPGFSHYLAIRKEEYIYMPSPAKAFGDRECIDAEAEHFKNPLKYSRKYSFNACQQECWNEFVFDKCGCVGPTDIGNQTECNPFQIIECYNEAFAKFAHKQCYCQMPCHVTTYRTKLSSTYFPNTNYFEQLYGNDFANKTLPYNLSTIRSDILLLRVFFDSKIVTTHRQVLEFNKEDLFSSLGGYLGLFVGASLVTLLDFVEHIFASFFRCFIPKQIS